VFFKIISCFAHTDTHPSLILSLLRCVLFMVNKYEEKQALGAAVPETQSSGSYPILISGGLFFLGSDQQHLA
jgi:hypothetical protein